LHRPLPDAWPASRGPAPLPRRLPLLPDQTRAPCLIQPCPPPFERHGCASSRARTRTSSSDVSRTRRKASTRPMTCALSVGVGVP
jgi:hypothetical protein